MKEPRDPLFPRGFKETQELKKEYPKPSKKDDELTPLKKLNMRRCSGKGLHLAMTGEPRGFSRVAAVFSSYDGEFRLPLVLAQASPNFHSSCEGKLGIALE